MQWHPNHEEKDSQIKDKKEGNRGKWKLWRSFTDDPKRYRGIKFAIKDQSEKLEKLKKENGDLAIQKQDALTCFQLTIYLLDDIKMEMARWKRLLEYYYQDVVNRD
jgi:hypothetical protein